MSARKTLQAAAKARGLRRPSAIIRISTRAPRGVDADHGAARRRHGELHEPEHEQDARLERAQVEVHDEEPAEKALQDRQEDLEALMLVEDDRGRRPPRERVDDRDEGRKDRPLVDRGRDEVHDGHRRLRDLARPVERRQLLGKLREERRDPLDEDERRDARRDREREHRLDEGVRRDDEHEAARRRRSRRSPSRGARALAAAPTSRRPGGPRSPRRRPAAGGTRRRADEVREVAERRGCSGVPEAERALPPDDGEPRERRQEAHDLERVLVVELDRDPGLALARPAREERRDEVDERPAEADEEPDRAREVRDREVDLRGVLPGLPRDDRLDGELGQRLEPREDREGEPLRDEELRGLGAPRDEKGREEDGRERPERRRAATPSRRSPPRPPGIPASSRPDLSTTRARLPAACPASNPRRIRASRPPSARSPQATACSSRGSGWSRRLSTRAVALDEVFVAASRPEENEDFLRRVRGEGAAGAGRRARLRRCDGRFGPRPSKASPISRRPEASRPSRRPRTARWRPLLFTF